MKIKQYTATALCAALLVTNSGPWIPLAVDAVFGTGIGFGQSDGTAFAAGTPFVQGNPDRPYISGVMHDSTHTDHIPATVDDMAEVELGFLIVGGEFDVFPTFQVFHPEFIVRPGTDDVTGDRGGELHLCLHRRYGALPRQTAV